MARTEVFTLSDPNDNTEARAIDDRIVTAKRALQEVVNQLIGVAENTTLADPVVNQSTHTINVLAAGGAAQSLSLFVPWHSFLWQQVIYDSESGSSHTTALFPTNAVNGTSVTVGAGPEYAYAQIVDPTNTATQTNPVGMYGLVLPAGDIITSVVGYFYRDNAANELTLSLQRHPIASAAGSTSIASTLSSGATTGAMETVTISPAHTILTDNWYRIQAAWTGSASNAQGRFYGVRVNYTSPTFNHRI